jgi:hypothetical protein
MFEGNYSLTEFTRLNRATPHPPGRPPIDLKVVQGLQKLMDALLVAFRTKPSQLLADHAVCLYQISSYVIAKLKQFQITVAFLETTTIPVTKNHHWLLMKVFEQLGMKMQFPAEPFNFDD